ncbi:salicylate synthase [Amycolatopsis coloradensis]|uniref:salicylate synthase n=1 Tax=Amycolatopsis coloradensis TaxID=76021 RepID=UPI001FC93A06|nr:salicylate synthase [Amycolatopsis coloradensis]
MPTSDDPLLVMASLARTFRADDHIVYESPNGYTFALGRLAEVTVDRDAVQVRWGEEKRRERWTSSPYPVLERLLAELPVKDWRAYGVADFELCYLGGDLHDILGDRPLLRLMIPESEVSLRDGEAVVRATNRRQLDQIASLVSGPAPDHGACSAPIAVEQEGVADYEKAVGRAIRDINGGKLQKVILSRVVPVPGAIDLVATYVEGRRNNTPVRSFLVRMDGHEAAGFSPEIVVRVDAQRQVTVQPLAGTRARHQDPAENARLRTELLADSKEIFEHTISVKVAHDELSAVCAPQAPLIAEFMAVKERGSVQHLGSEVRAELPENRGVWDAFAALFPAVTVSGIPKDAAYRCIRENESGPRGWYGGAVLAVGQDGTLDAALVLRTVFHADGRTWLRAGAGIVAQSNPAREVLETSEKLRSVALHVVPATEDSHAEMRRDIADQLGVEPAELTDDEDLVLRGLSSLSVMALANSWSTNGTVVRYTDLLERPTLAHWSALVKR